MAASEPTLPQQLTLRFSALQLTFVATLAADGNATVTEIRADNRELLQRLLTFLHSTDTATPARALPNEDFVLRDGVAYTFSLGEQGEPVSVVIQQVK
jgi:hypothetical protein